MSNTNNLFLYKFIFFISVFPLIFEDLPLVNIFGSIAKCPNFLIAPVITLFLILNLRKLEYYIISKYYAVYMVITIITSLIMLAITVLFVTNGSFNVYNEFFPIKLIKAASYNLTYFFTAYNLSILVRKISLTSVCNILGVIWLFLTSYGLIEFFIPYPIAAIHFTIVAEYKTRLVLTASEPSSCIVLYTTVAISHLVLRFYLKRNKLITSLITILSLVILLGISSGGGLLFLGISFLWVFRKNFTWKFAVIMLVLFVPLAYFFIQNVVPRILVDIDEFSSFSTRTTTLIVGFKSLFIFPIGEGYGTYLQYFPKMLIPTNKQLSSFIGLPLLDNELVDMVNTGENLGVKSGIPHELMLNGFSAVIFFYFIFKYYFDTLKCMISPLAKTTLLFVGTFFVLDFIFGSGFETSYIFLIPFILLSIIVENETNERVISNQLSKTLL